MLRLEKPYLDFSIADPAQRNPLEIGWRNDGWFLYEDLVDRNQRKELRVSQTSLKHLVELAVPDVPLLDGIPQQDLSNIMFLDLQGQKDEEGLRGALIRPLPVKLTTELVDGAFDFGIEAWHGSETPGASQWETISAVVEDWDLTYGAEGNFIECIQREAKHTFEDGSTSPTRSTIQWKPTAGLCPNLFFVAGLRRQGINQDDADELEGRMAEMVEEIGEAIATFSGYCDIHFGADLLPEENQPNVYKWCLHVPLLGKPQLLECVGSVEVSENVFEHKWQARPWDGGDLSPVSPQELAQNGRTYFIGAINDCICVSEGPFGEGTMAFYRVKKQGQPIIPSGHVMIVHHPGWCALWLAPLSTAWFQSEDAMIYRQNLRIDNFNDRLARYLSNGFSLKGFIENPAHPPDEPKIWPATPPGWWPAAAEWWAGGPVAVPAWPPHGPYGQWPAYAPAGWPEALPWPPVLSWNAATQTWTLQPMPTSEAPSMTILYGGAVTLERTALATNTVAAGFYDRWPTDPPAWWPDAYIWNEETGVPSQPGWPPEGPPDVWPATPPAGWPSYLEWPPGSYDEFGTWTPREVPASVSTPGEAPPGTGERPGFSWELHIEPSWWDSANPADLRTFSSPFVESIAIYQYATLTPNSTVAALTYFPVGQVQRASLSDDLEASSAGLHTVTIDNRLGTAPSLASTWARRGAWCKLVGGWSYSDNSVTSQTLGYYIIVEVLEDTQVAQVAITDLLGMLSLEKLEYDMNFRNWKSKAACEFLLNLAGMGAATLVDPGGVRWFDMEDLGTVLEGYRDEWAFSAGSSYLDALRAILQKGQHDAALWYDAPNYTIKSGCRYCRTARTAGTWASHQENGWAGSACGSGVDHTIYLTSGFNPTALTVGEDVATSRGALREGEYANVIIVRGEAFDGRTFTHRWQNQRVIAPEAGHMTSDYVGWRIAEVDSAGTIKRTSDAMTRTDEIRSRMAYQGVTINNLRLPFRPTLQPGDVIQCFGGGGVHVHSKKFRVKRRNHEIESGATFLTAREMVGSSAS